MFWKKSFWIDVLENNLSSRKNVSEIRGYNDEVNCSIS